MFTSFEQVNRELFKILFGGSTGSINMNLPSGEAFTVYPRFYKQGAKDFTEASNDSSIYPTIIFMSNNPVVDQSKYYPDQPEFGEITDEDLDGEDDTIKLFPFPLPMDFNYEISVCSKSERQQQAVNQWLNKRFAYDTNKALTMNVGAPPVETFYGPDCVDADYVRYKFDYENDPVRSDGVFESIYQLHLYPYVYLACAVAVPLLKDLNIGLGRVNR